MKSQRNVVLLVFLTLSLVLPLFYNACSFVGSSETTTQKSLSIETFNVYGTNTGNPKPTNACERIVNATCEVLTKAIPTLDSATCYSGVLSTSLINNFGVPEKILNPYYNLCSAEKNAAVFANEDSLNKCLIAIQNLPLTSPLVQASYNPDAFNPFSGLTKAIPSNYDECGNVFRENSFTLPPPPVPDPNTVLVDFDNPAVGPPTTTNEIYGVFQGIAFTGGVWGWSLPFSANASNFAVNSGATTGDTGFSFVNGPQQLISIDAFATKADVTLRIYDEQGQSKTQLIPADQKVHRIVTGFTKSSNYIYFNRTTSIPDPYRTAGLGMDNIVYKKSAFIQKITMVQSQDSRNSSSTQKINANFDSANSAGNAIIALVHWKDAKLSGVSDLAGNFYRPVTEITATANGNKQQIWIAENIKSAAKNVVSANFTSSNSIQLMFIQEFSGVVLENSVESSLSLVGNGQTAQLPDFDVTSADRLIYVAVNSDWGWANFQPPYTGRPYFGWYPHGDQYVREPGRYGFSATLDVPTSWNVHRIVIKPK